MKELEIIKEAIELLNNVNHTEITLLGCEYVPEVAQCVINLESKFFHKTPSHKIQMRLGMGWFRPDVELGIEDRLPKIPEDITGDKYVLLRVAAWIYFRWKNGGSF